MSVASRAKCPVRNRGPKPVSINAHRLASARLGALALGMGMLAAQSLIAGTGSRARGAPLPTQAASARLLAGPRGIGYRDDRCAT